ncbi:MAG: hypothetical protein P1S60_20530, partial [Anaerolineae bacterium]|nr:hypothetical protein [Anaerolineae bacterium]
GTVINNTPEGVLPVDQPVTLQFFSDGDWTSIYTSTVKVDGTFVFGDLDALIGQDFVTRVEYEGVEYFSTPAVLEDSVDVELFIYDSTDDPSEIRIDQAHFFIVPIENTLQIAEYYLLGNGGVKTYSGRSNSDSGTRVTTSFPLPEGAANLKFDGPGLGERYIGDAFAFSDTRPVPPGEATIDVSFQYEIALSPDLVINRVNYLPVSSAVFIISGGELGLQGDGINFTGIMDTQMGPAASYTAGPMTSMEPLSFRVVPLTEGEFSQAMADTPATKLPRQRNASQETVIGAVILIISVVIAFQLWGATPKPAVPDTAENLLSQIARLDIAYESDEVSEDIYQSRRKALVRQVRDLV